MIEVNHSQCTCAAMDAQDAGRELSRLEAVVIAQYIADGVDWFALYYDPASQAQAISNGIAEHYANARWDERIAWDMLGTYCLNTPAYGVLPCAT